MNMAEDATRFGMLSRLASGSVVAGGPYSAEDVAQRAFRDKVGLIHAAHQLWAEGIRGGTIPSDTCGLCGGHSWAGTGEHNLCRARVNEGLPVERIEVAERPCTCVPCQDLGGG